MCSVLCTMYYQECETCPCYHKTVMESMVLIWEWKAIHKFWHIYKCIWWVCSANRNNTKVTRSTPAFWHECKKVIVSWLFRMELLTRLVQLVSWYLRPLIKWFLRQTTRLCELQRICYGEPCGSPRTLAIGGKIILNDLLLTNEVDTLFREFSSLLKKSRN